MNRETAATELAHVFYRFGVERTIDAFLDALHTPGGQDKQTWQALKTWHEAQTEETKALLHFLVKEVAILAAFGLSVHFDGASGYEDIQDRPAEFAIHLNLYQDYEQAEEGTPYSVIEVCPTRRGENVHDLFLNVVDQVRLDQQ